MTRRHPCPARTRDSFRPCARSRNCSRAGSSLGPPRGPLFGTFRAGTARASRGARRRGAAPSPPARPRRPRHAPFHPGRRARRGHRARARARARNDPWVSPRVTSTTGRRRSWRTHGCGSHARQRAAPDSRPRRRRSTLLGAMGALTDLISPWFAGHSTGVAELAEARPGARAGGPTRTVCGARRSGPDLGRVAVHARDLGEGGTARVGRLGAGAAAHVLHPSALCVRPYSHGLDRRRPGRFAPRAAGRLGIPPGPRWPGFA